MVGRGVECHLTNHFSGKILWKTYITTLPNRCFFEYFIKIKSQFWQEITLIIFYACFFSVNWRKLPAYLIWPKMAGDFPEGWVLRSYFSVLWN